MKHPDENTIELYVLGERSLGEQRKSIENHLRRCGGCRELEQRIRSLYSSVEEELKKSPQGIAAPADALVRSEREMELWDPYHDVVRGRPISLETWWHSMRNAIVRRPIAAAVGSLAFVGIISFVILYTATSAFKDTNPSYVHYNIGAGLLEVYNKGNAKIWEIPCDDLKGDASSDAELRVKSSVVTDLEGKGRSVVVSTVRMADDNQGNSLRIIDGQMNIRTHITFGVRHIQFRGKQYDARFNPSQPAIVTMEKNKNILLTASNGRSPCVVIRYDASGRVVGEYWHFGVFRGAYAVNLNNDGRDELLLIGSNDVGQGDADSYPNIVVLDPSKIVGETESSATRGFGYPASGAELYYLRLDMDEICSVFRSHPFMKALLSASENVLRFATAANVLGTDNYMPNFEFVFDKRLAPIEVKNEDQTVREVERLKAQGKTSITLDSAYMDKLKHAVRYWNGREWVKEVATVEAGLAVK